MVMRRKKIGMIISGGQTGADRAAFDFAIENKIRIGGFVPKDRLAEDGEISEKYPNLRETETSHPAERTELNVKEADATLILSHGELRGGSLATGKFAEKYQKPVLHIDFLVSDIDEAAKEINQWLDSVKCEKLNVAGARASEDHLIYEKTTELLEKLLSTEKSQ